MVRNSWWWGWFLLWQQWGGQERRSPVLFNTGVQPMGFTFRVDLSPHYISLKTLLHTRVEVCLLGYFKSSEIDNEDWTSEVLRATFLGMPGCCTKTRPFFVKWNWQVPYWSGERSAMGCLITLMCYIMKTRSGLFGSIKLSAALANLG